ncbi:MAG: hypothetical protein M3R15_21415 [Acidobacteriota bacterium]|nr:hypothetical protein [Acidobacteriota bacterium]
MNIGPATAEAMLKAIDKAYAVRPLMRVLNFGSYAVTKKQTGATYTVTCEKRGDEKFADCTRKAGERGQKCDHVAAAVPAYIVIAAEQAALPAVV